MSLKKLAVGIEDSIAVGLLVDACAPALSFTMMALHLHAVIGSHIPAKHQALYLYSSMLFFTSTSGISMTSKQNAVAETITILFLILQSITKKVRQCTSEPSEHTFAILRGDHQEFSIGEFCLLSEK